MDQYSNTIYFYDCSVKITKSKIVFPDLLHFKWKVSPSIFNI
jgi:hypothetical protein